MYKIIPFDTVKGVIRIYGKLINNITAKLANYSLYIDNKGLYWLYIESKYGNHIVPFIYGLLPDDYIKMIINK